MLKKFAAAALFCVLLVPVLFSDMRSLGDNTVMPVQGMGGAAPQPVRTPHNSDTNRTKTQAISAPAHTDNVNDILAFEEKLNLTSQQSISIRLIASDAMLELTEKSGIALTCRREYDKSLNQNTPDFTYIRSMLNKLTEAQANALEVSVNAYEKAYALLTDTQKANLSFFRALRQQEIEKNAESSSQDDKQAISTSTFIESPSTIKH
jgi:Spy/CpxP family protein refolding chaperone